MSNTLTALQKQYYSKMVQKELYFRVSALSLANMVDMSHGTTYHKPLIDFNTVQSYTKNTDITVQDNVTADETLTINQTPLVPTGIDQIELLEIDYGLLDTVAKNAAQVIREDLDGNFFNEVLNASNSNSAAVALTAGVSGNTVNTYAQAIASLVNEGVDEGALNIVADPHSIATIGEAALGNTYKEADMEFRRGFRGQFVWGAVVRSTLLTATGDLALATNPTANDTVTANSVVFKFVDTPAAAGDVAIGVSAAVSVDNLVAAINGGAGAGTAYIEVSNRERTRKLAGLTATDNTTSITLTSKRGYRAVSSTLTAAADKWGIITINNCIMEKGAISLAVQKGINVVTRDKPLQLGTNFFTWMRYGLKTFTEGADRMYRLQIVAQAAEA